MPVKFSPQWFMARAQKALQAHLQIVKALQPDSDLGAAVKGVALGAHAYAQKIVHVDTANLKNALRIDPHYGAVGGYGTGAGRHWTAAAVEVGGWPHPRSGVPANVYGYWEHDRGGSHAFFDRTVREAGDRLVRAAGTELAARLPQGG